MNANVSLRVGALAALLLPSLAWAQPWPAPAPAPAAQTQTTAPAPPPMTTHSTTSTQASAQPAAPALDPATAAEVEQRIAALKTRLGITPAQEASWDAFAQVMRDNTTNTDTLFAQRVSSATTMSAPDNMHSYAQIARTYADNTERLSAAFDTLYADLTDQQKAAADVLFREQPTEQQQRADQQPQQMQRPVQR